MATTLSLCLTGEVLKVAGRIASQEVTNYEKLKWALLQRFRPTAKRYRQNF